MWKVSILALGTTNAVLLLLGVVSSFDIVMHLRRNSVPLSWSLTGSPWYVVSVYRGSNARTKRMDTVAKWCIRTLLHWCAVV